MARQFEPVHLPPEKHPQTISVSLAVKEAACPRAAFLYLLHDGGTSSAEMIRGNTVHAAIERCIQTMRLEQEQRIPGDVARDIASEVIAEGVRLGRDTDPLPGHVPVPFEEADYVRMCVFRWSEHFEADPASIVGVEQMFHLKVGDWTLRGKLDLATVDGRTLHIRDWKSSRAMPSYDEVAIVRSDGRMMPKQAQLIMYALLARFGTPVAFNPCGDCDGPTTDPQATSCESCEGRGGEWIELPRWPAAERYELTLAYPGIEVDGGMAERGPLILEERDLHDFRRTLEGQLAGFGRRLESGDWPAVPGSHCSECPAQMECPIPPQLRDWQGAITDLEHAERVAEMLFTVKKQSQTVQKALREAAQANGWDLIRCGSDRGFAFKTRESRETNWSALEQASQAGRPVDLDAVRKKKVSTEFSDRKLTASEMEEGAA